MKLKHLFEDLDSNSGQIIASFGSARLVRTFTGQYQLMGGTRDERSEATEWISLFMHEAVIPQ